MNSSMNLFKGRHWLLGKLLGETLIINGPSRVMTYLLG